MDYTPYLFIGLMVASCFAFRIFLPDYFSRGAPIQNRLRAQEVSGYAGAIVFALMALSLPEGEGGLSWLAAVVMFAGSAVASAKRQKMA